MFYLRPVNGKVSDPLITQESRVKQDPLQKSPESFVRSRRVLDKEAHFTDSAFVIFVARLRKAADRSALVRPRTEGSRCAATGLSLLRAAHLQGLIGWFAGKKMLIRWASAGR